MLFRFTLLILFFVLLHATSRAQRARDPEFSGGWLLLAKGGTGLVSGFRAATPDVFAGEISLNPQVTVAPQLLRLGMNAGLVYTDKKVSALAGPMAAIKLKTLGTKYFGSYANLQALAEAAWGTQGQRLAGGGLAIEALGKLHIGVRVLRDYRLNNWWLQSFIGIQLNKIKQKKDEYED